MITETTSRHSCTNPDWISPSWLVEAAREVMGSIDLDPMSDVEAQTIVKATSYYTIEINGLMQPWYGNVFINPAGGTVAEAWTKLVATYHTPLPKMHQAIWIGYSLEQLQTLQSLEDVDSPLLFPICVPKRRIPFVENTAMRAARIQRLLEKGEAPGASKAAQKTARDIRAGKEPPNSPSHANYICYLGLRVARFKRVFEKFGAVRSNGQTRSEWEWNGDKEDS